MNNSVCICVSLSLVFNTSKISVWGPKRWTLQNVIKMQRLKTISEELINIYAAELLFLLFYQLGHLKTPLIYLVTLTKQFKLAPHWAITTLTCCSYFDSRVLIMYFVKFIWYISHSPLFCKTRAVTLVFLVK